jgi:hypothetical protein
MLNSSGSKGRRSSGVSPIPIITHGILIIMVHKARHGWAMELKGVGTPALAIKMEKVVLGELNSRQPSFSELHTKLFEGF